MRIFIVGLVMLFVGLYFWFATPSFPMEILGIKILLRELAPIITIIGIIGAVVGYFVKL